MGKTKYPDTNNQYAYRTDRYNFLKRIKDKAETLWIDGYRAMLSPCGNPHLFLVYREVDGIQCGYKVNPVTQTCTCKFYEEQYTEPLDPADPGKRIPCKHLLGLKDLIGEEVSYFKMLEKTAQNHPHNAGSRDRAISYSVMWSNLEIAWNQAMGAFYRRRAA